MKLAIYIAILFFSFQAFGQKKPFREIIETDSSTIEIIRNSVYRCYEETYKSKDSIWWNVTYIDDTTQLHTEGWKNKSGKYLGIWKEFNRQGELMYTWNHVTGECDINKSLYPYHDLLEKMKFKADSIIISAYSMEFFEKHVKFNYECNAYLGHNETYSTGTFWINDYLGSWTEPLKGKPNTFMFRYDIQYDSGELFSRGIELELDSIGNYIPDEDKGFERLSDNSPKVISVDKTNILQTIRKNGFEISDTATFFCFLTWESFKKNEFFNGQYKYYVAVKIDEIKEINENENGRSRVTEKFKVYSFNPWTGEYIETKKMKSVREWEKLSGFSTGLMPDE
jgi:hypothetical protein